MYTKYLQIRENTQGTQREISKAKYKSTFLNMRQDRSSSSQGKSWAGTGTKRRSSSELICILLGGGINNCCCKLIGGAAVACTSLEFLKNKLG
jgi:hypothetical protein